MISKCASCSKLKNISFLPRYQERHLWDITEAGPDQNSCGRALLDPRYKSGPFLAGWGLRIMAVCPCGDYVLGMGRGFMFCILCVAQHLEPSRLP